MRTPGPARAAWGVVALALLALVGAGQAEPPADVEALVKLVSGKVLQGRVTGHETVQGNRLLRVTTDLGQFLVPAKEVKEKVEPKVDPEATFFAGRIRVVRIQGKVERQAVRGGEWFPVQWADAYGHEVVNAPNAIVKPGDRIRTGPESELDLQLHKDAWVRLLPGSEVDLPAARAGAGTLGLLAGKIVPQVNGRPSGETFRVVTPSAVLGVRGTLFSVDATPGRTTVCVAEGEVRSQAGSGLTEGLAADFAAASTSEARSLTAPERAELARPRTHLPPDDLVLIPGGTYLLGSALNVEADPDAAHGTFYSYAYQRQGSIELTPYLIDRREVSAGEFEAFRTARHPARAGGGPGPEYPSRPALGMSRDEARSYARWVGRDLPSPSQWEAAARGPAGRKFPWGDPRSPKPLPAGTWNGGLPAGDITTLGWSPPASLPEVDMPTHDVTPLGVVALVSSVPEYVAPLAPNDPLRALLSDNFRDWYARNGPGVELIRGIRGSTVGMIWRGDAPLPAGFRTAQGIPER